VHDTDYIHLACERAAELYPCSQPTGAVRALALIKIAEHKSEVSIQGSLGFTLFRHRSDRPLILA
jgi:hypothetical protein